MCLDEHPSEERYIRRGMMKRGTHSGRRREAYASHSQNIPAAKPQSGANEVSRVSGHDP